MVLHIDEHVGGPQPAILARIVVEQEHKGVRQGTDKVPARVLGRVWMSCQPPSKQATQGVGSDYRARWFVFAKKQAARVVMHQTAAVAKSQAPPFFFFSKWVLGAQCDLAQNGFIANPKMVAELFDDQKRPPPP